MRHRVYRICTLCLGKNRHAYMPQNSRKYGPLLIIQSMDASVIVMTRAQYGRMRISRCVKLDYGHLGCEADVLELADARCSGRRRCEIRIPDPEFAKNKPCPEDLKPYFQAAYKCVKGTQLYRFYNQSCCTWCWYWCMICT